MSSNVPEVIIRNPEYRFLPPCVGNNWEDTAFKCNHKKQQVLQKEFTGISVAGNMHRKIYTAAPLQEMEISNKAREYLASLTYEESLSRQSNFTGKRYVTLNDKVLRFYAAFREHIPDSGINDYWHRHVTICFFPEDNTIMIEEHAEINSGLRGGTLLKRQNVKVDVSQQEEFPSDKYITLNHMNVGKAVRINGINYYIYDCDKYTRHFLTSLNVAVGESEECPFKVDVVDQSTNNNRFIKTDSCHIPQLECNAKTVSAASLETSKAKYVNCGRKKSLKGNIDNGFVCDDCILRFYGVLHEENNSCGVKEKSSVKSFNVNQITQKTWNIFDDRKIIRWLEIYLFTSDMSIAIAEKICDNTCQTARKVKYLNRCLLPKSGELSRENELTFNNLGRGKLALENTINYQSSDSANDNEDEDNTSYYYTYKNLFIGATINVFGKSVFIYDCDEFTRKFYEQILEVQLNPSINVTSEQCVKTLESEKEVVQELQNKMYKSNKMNGATSINEVSRSIASNEEGRILRFYMLLQSPKSIDERHQKFTLSYYVDTSELSIYVKSVLPNSGYEDKCFLKRQKVMKDTGSSTIPFLSLTKPSNNTYDRKEEEHCYKPQDFYVGAVVKINNYVFKVTQMDANASAFYTKVNSAARPTNNTNVICLLTELCNFCHSRFGTVVKTFLAFDRDKDGFISKSEFCSVLCDLQLTRDVHGGKALFEHLCGVENGSVLTFEDVSKWMHMDVSKPTTAKATKIKPTFLVKNVSEDQNFTTFTAANSAISTDKRNNNIVVNSASDEYVVNNATITSDSINNNDNSINHDRNIIDKRENPTCFYSMDENELLKHRSRIKLLTLIKEKLESKFTNVTDIFCFISSMPKICKTKSVNTCPFTNVHRNASITPSQLEQTLINKVGLPLCVNEVNEIIEFFFNVNVHDANSNYKEKLQDHYLSLPEFQKKFQDLLELTSLTHN